MLNIKFNINKFTIIFSEDIRTKINAENISHLSPPSSTSVFQFQHLCLSVSALSLFDLFSSFFLFQPSSLCFSSAPPFLFQFSASLFVFFSYCLYFLPWRLNCIFLLTCCPFFSPKRFSVAASVSFI